MSVSDPSNPSLINCTVIDLYTQSLFLKVTMVAQGMAGIISLLSITLTLRKILSTVMVDRVFKEYLLASHAVQLMQAAALALLQIILLTSHLISAPCEAFIPARLCYLLRITTTTISTLPFLNVALTIFRFLVLQSNVHQSGKQLIWIYRGLQLLALLAGLGLQVFKYSTVDMDGYVVYCIGNFYGLHDKIIYESISMSCCEAFTIIFSAYLYGSYKKCERTFEVNSSLLRRQTIQTFRLFISFSLLQAFIFLAFSGLSTAYRTYFKYLPEPQYSAGSGLFFLPMYYTMFSSWLIYYILRRKEKKRVETMQKLLAREDNQTHEYFTMIKSQWAGPPSQQRKLDTRQRCNSENDQTTNIDRLVNLIRKKRNRVRPVRPAVSF